MARAATNSTRHLHHRAFTAVGSLVVSSMTEAKPVKEAPGVERGGGRGIDRQGETFRFVSPALAAAQVPPESVDLKTPLPFVRA